MSIVSGQYIDRGSHELQTDQECPVSHFRRDLVPRSGTRLEYGYSVVHKDLVGGMGSFGRNMPMGQTDIATSFNGNRTYFANLVDEASGLEFVAVKAQNGRVTEIHLLHPDVGGNPFHEQFKDVKAGYVPAENVFNQMALAYLALGKKDIEQTLPL